MALWSIAFLGVRPIGSLLDGILASWAGLRIAAFAIAIPAILAAVALVVAGVRSGRRRTSAAGAESTTRMSDVRRGLE